MVSRAESAAQPLSTAYNVREWQKAQACLPVVSSRADSRVAGDAACIQKTDITGTG